MESLLIAQLINKVNDLLNDCRQGCNCIGHWLEITVRQSG
jgi:hypothetical protein